MIKIARELVQLKKEKKELDRELKECREHISDLETELSEHFVEEGVSSIAVDGFNVILVEKKRVNCDQSDLLVDYLQGIGAEVFNKPVNPVSLTSYVNKNPEILEEIGQYVEVTDLYSFQVRKK